MAFHFVIPADAIAVGTPLANTEIVADRQLSRNVTQEVLVASFGDGYEQRVVDGINPKRDTFSISFANREAAEINLIAEFFDIMAGKSFSLFVPKLGSTEDIKVVCSNYNIMYLYETYHTCTAEFRRVYEP